MCSTMCCVCLYNVQYNVLCLFVQCAVQCAVFVFWHEAIKVIYSSHDFWAKKITCSIVTNKAHNQNAAGHCQQDIKSCLISG